ncbi:MAG: hypothetical protein EOM15_17730 [Spirochaetia bacterium]|nr:hypothetical protein [Spirochaetia bacterium]
MKDIVYTIFTVLWLAAPILICIDVIYMRKVLDKIERSLEVFIHIDGVHMKKALDKIEKLLEEREWDLGE